MSGAGSPSRWSTSTCSTHSLKLVSPVTDVVVGGGGSVCHSGDVGDGNGDVVVGGSCCGSGIVLVVSLVVAALVLDEVTLVLVVILMLVVVVVEAVVLVVVLVLVMVLMSVSVVTVCQYLLTSAWFAWAAPIVPRHNRVQCQSSSSAPLVVFALLASSAWVVTNRAEPLESCS